MKENCSWWIIPLGKPASIPYAMMETIRHNCYHFIINVPCILIDGCKCWPWFDGGEITKCLSQIILRLLFSSPVKQISRQFQIQCINVNEDIKCFKSHIKFCNEQLRLTAEQPHTTLIIPWEGALKLFSFTSVKIKSNFSHFISFAIL